MAEQQMESLDRAFALIEQDEIEEARGILRNLIDTEPDNPDVWWLYAHAVEDVGEAQTALRNVSRLNPEYPGLHELQQELAQITGVSPEATIGQQKLSDLDVFEDDFELDALALDDELPAPREVDDGHLPDLTEIEDNPRGRFRRILVMVAIILVLAVVGTLILLSGGDNEETPSSATAVPSVESSVTEETTIPALDATSANAMVDLLTDELILANSSTQDVLTELGQTEVASICTEVGEGLRNDLARAFELLASGFDALSQDKDAFALQMIDCSNGDTINTIGVPATSLVQFANGTLSSEEFQGSWVAVVLDPTD